jgi:hypothetical protein
MYRTYGMLRRHRWQVAAQRVTKYGLDTNWQRSNAGRNDYFCFSPHAPCGKKFTKGNNAGLDGIYYSYCGRYWFCYPTNIHGLDSNPNSKVDTEHARRTPIRSLCKDTGQR